MRAFPNDSTIMYASSQVENKLVKIKYVINTIVHNLLYNVQTCSIISKLIIMIIVIISSSVIIIIITTR